MAELADAQVLGTCVRKDVWVRPPLRAPNTTMSTIKQIISKIDKFASMIRVIEHGDTVLNISKLYVNSRSDFYLAIAKNGRRYAITKGGEFSRFNGFDGVILDRYNMNIYRLADYMAQMGILTPNEVGRFQEYAEKQRHEQYEQHKVQTAINDLVRQGYKVTK